MKVIPLSRGLNALVDDEDYEAVSAFKWHAITAGKNGNFYAARRERGSTRVLLMHREILKPAGSSIKVDHVNGNGLDNRRSNLRFATQAQNRANTRRFSASSGFKGVHLEKRTRTYKVCVAGKTICYRKTAEEAARVYDEIALAKWGEFAATNVALGLLPPLEQPA